MQPGLFLQIIIMILQGICTEATFIYVFYLIFGKKRSWRWILPVAVIIELLLIPATYILQLQFIFVGLGQISSMAVNCFLNILIFLFIERKEERKKVCTYIILAFFVWAAAYIALAGIVYNDIIKSFVDGFIERTVYANLLLVAPAAVTCFIIAWAANFIDQKYSFHDVFKRIGEKLNYWPRILFCFIIMAVLLSLPDIMERANLSTDQSLSFISVLYVIFIMMFLHLIRANIYQEQKTQMQTEMLGQQEMYIQELESIQSSMRSFRHDYKNMMSSLYLQSREGNMEEVEKNIHGLIDEFDENIDRKMNLTVQMATIRISEVKSLLYKKITEIQKKGIDFRMEVMYPVEETGMKPLDLSRVLGILLDNAVEAVEQVHGDISLVISAQADGVHIILDNMVDQDVDIPKIYEDGYSTKGSGRGTGLYSLREITANYENVNLMTECTNLRFIQRIDILNKSDKKIK